LAVDEFVEPDLSNHVEAVLAIAFNMVRSFDKLDRTHDLIIANRSGNTSTSSVQAILGIFISGNRLKSKEFEYPNKF